MKNVKKQHETELFGKSFRYVRTRNHVRIYIYKHQKTKETQTKGFYNRMLSQKLIAFCSPGSFERYQNETEIYILQEMVFFIYYNEEHKNDSKNRSSTERKTFKT